MSTEADAIEATTAPEFTETHAEDTHGQDTHAEETAISETGDEGADDPVESALAERPEIDPDAPLVEGPGFWGTVGAGIASGARVAGRGIAAAYNAVDPDVRRDIARMPILGLTVLGRRHVPIEPMAEDGRRPILFVHGLGGHRGNFLPMRSWFALKGRRRTYSIGLPDDDLIDLGDRFTEIVREVVAVNGLKEDDRIDIVAHSMGGLVARLALLDVGVTNRVHTLVTLGSPHGGTHAARFAGSGRAKELRPDSEVIKRLSVQIPWAGPTRLVCLWSKADPLMQPATTAVMDGAESEELPDMTHTAYLLDRRAWRAVRAALAG